MSYRLQIQLGTRVLYSLISQMNLLGAPHFFRAIRSDNKLIVINDDVFKVFCSVVPETIKVNKHLQRPRIGNLRRSREADDFSTTAGAQRPEDKKADCD